MRNSFLCMVSLAIFFISCKKDNVTAGLQMRIRNSTASSFSYTTASGAEFGQIATGAVTIYQSFDAVKKSPQARIVIGSDTLFAGEYYFCETLPAPMLEPGKYTMEIYEDSISVPGFLQARFIKD